MVLKSIIRYIINRYLKNYIEQLDDEKLDFDLRNGHVTLENLHLKPEALVDLNLPVTVAAGYLEKFSLTIPWLHLSTHPSKVHIHGLYMLVVPKNEIEHDFSEYHANKMRRVQRKVDNLRKAMIENKKLDEKELTFFERIRLQIIENIEIVLENFHISYETNSTTKLGHPFSFGFTLHYLKIITDFEKHKKKRTKEIVYKIEQLNSFSVYWATQCESRVHLPFHTVIENLKTNIPLSNSTRMNNNLNYILHPVDIDTSFVIKLKSGENNYDRSTFDIDGFIKELTLNIDSKQFSDLLDFAKFQNYSSLYERCEEYRQLLIDHAVLTDEQKDRLKILESKLDVFNLAYIRHSVEMEIENETSMENKTSNRWNWWGKKKSKYHHGKEFPLNCLEEKSISKSKMEEHHYDGYSFHLEDIPNILLNIRFETLHLNLVQSDPIANGFHREIITHVNVNGGEVNVTKRSLSSSLLILFHLQSFRLFGLRGNRDHSPLLVEPIPKCSPLMNIEFELYPININSDYRFHLNLQPIVIIYDAETFNRIVQCFPSNVKSLFNEIKERQLSEMEDDLSSQKMFDLKVELENISIIFPENGFYQKNCSMMKIHCEQFLLKSSSERLKEERFYNQYKLQINHLKMILYSDQLNIRLLDDISLIEMDFFKCIYSNDLHLDDWKIHVQMKTNKSIDISKNSLEKVFLHFQSIPHFNSTILEITSRINLYFEIFYSNTSIKAEISIDQCLFMIENNQKIFLQTDIESSISRKRTQLEKVIFILKNLQMTTNRISNPFYINQQLQLNYIKSFFIH